MSKVLAVARENTTRQGLANHLALTGNARALPFPDGHFHTINCRMGFVFFLDMQLAAQQMYRVLKPGGQLATCVWSAPPHSPWITTIIGTMSSHLALPARRPRHTSLRLAQPTGLLKTAGFQHIQEEKLRSTVEFDSPAQYWQNMLEVAALVVLAMSQANEATHAASWQALFAKLTPLLLNGQIFLPFGALVLAKEKPNNLI